MTDSNSGSNGPDEPSGDSGEYSAAPQNRRRVQGDDYAEGSNVSEWKVAERIDYFARRVDKVNNLRRSVLWVCILVLVCLLWALGITVNSFVKQVDKVTPAVNELVLKPKASDVKAELNEEKGSGNTATSKQVKVDSNVAGTQSTVTSSVSPASSTTTVSVDLTSIGYPIVAVVTVLVISIAALTIVLLRTTYALTTTGESTESKSGTGDVGIPLPGVEVATAVAEALAGALKGLFKKD